MCAGRQERYARKSEAEDLKRVFHRLDSKGDNKIDVEELMAIFAQYKHKVTKVIAATHFRRLSSRSPARPRGPENADARGGKWMLSLILQMRDHAYTGRGGGHDMGN